jgi:hypothetical protein
VRRCVGYAKRWGYGALCLTNLFAFRASDPRVLKAHPSPVGADNDRWLAALARRAGIVIAAWGVEGTHLGRDSAVLRLLGRELSCLRRTKGGHPGHPLYLPRSLTPVPFGSG